MAVNKKELVTALREQHASLLERRDKLTEQIEQVEVALAAFGAGTRRSPQTPVAPRRQRVPVKVMAERLYAVLTPDTARTARELADELETGEQQVYRAMRLLMGEGRAAALVPDGETAKHYTRPELRLGVET